MSARALQWAFEQRLATPFQQIVLYTVADWADPQGVARQCDIHRLAECSRLSPTKVRKHLAEMRAAGAIVTTEKFSEDGERIYDISLHMEKIISVRREAVPEKDARETTASSVALHSGNFPADSPEGKAIAMAYRIGHLADYFHKTRLRGGIVYFGKPVTPRLLALANVPDRAAWAVLDRQQAAAWDGLIRDVAGERLTRRRLQAGDSAPWPWPPKVNGELSAATSPPLMSDADADDLADEGNR